MSGEMTKGESEHPKQEYSVGKNFVGQAERVNSGRLDSSSNSEVVAVTTDTLVEALATLMSVPCCDFTLGAFGSIGLTVAEF
jgi:hypothetical protein